MWEGGPPCYVWMDFLVLAEEGSDRFVVCINAPLGDFAFFDKGSEGRGRLPVILRLQLSVRRESSLCDAEHHHHRAGAIGFFDGHGIVRNHAEVGGPGGPHRLTALYHGAHRVDKPMCLRH